MKDTAVKIAVIGVGVNTQRNHLPQLKRLSDEGECVIVGICDINTERAQKVGHAYHCSSIFGDVDRMLTEVKPDAVFIAGTPTMQYENSKKALIAGVSVFVEKPPAPSLAKTLELISLAEQKKCRFFCGFNRRFEPGIAYLKEQFPEGSRLVSLEGVFNTPSLNKPAPYEIDSWFYSNGIHAIDTLLFLAGKRPTHVFSAQTKGSSSVDGAYTAILSWEHGVHAVFSSYNCVGTKREAYSAHGLGVSYTFEKGSVTVVRDGSVVTEKPALPSDSGFYREHQEFLRLVRGTEYPSSHVPLRIAETMHLLDLIRDGHQGAIEWSRLGVVIQPVAVPPARAVHTSSVLVLNPEALQEHLPRIAESATLVFRHELEHMNQEACGRIHAIITGRERDQSIPVTDVLLERVPNLKVVGVVGASVKKYVSETLVKKEIPIINVSDVYGVAVAEFNLMQAMVGIKYASKSHDIMRKGGWNTNESTFVRRLKRFMGRHRRYVAMLPASIQDKIFSTQHSGVTSLTEKAVGGHNLYGRTVGLVGYGAIAREFIRLLKPFSCDIKVYSEFMTQEEADSFGVVRVSLDDALNAEIVSIHRGLSERTYKGIGARELNLLRPGTVLINAARGQLFDEDALIQRLRRGDIFACLDVYAIEPLPKNSPLRSLENVFLTSHIAGATVDMFADAPKLLVEKVVDFLQGEAVPHSITSPDFFKNMT